VGSLRATLSKKAETSPARTAARRAASITGSVAGSGAVGVATGGGEGLAVGCHGSTVALAVAVAAWLIGRMADGVGGLVVGRWQAARTTSPRIIPARATAIGQAPLRFHRLRML
jgi:hypothetical protein